MIAEVVTGDLKQFFVDKRAELDRIWDNRRNERQESELAEYRQSLASGREALENMDHSAINALLESQQNDDDDLLASVLNY